MKYTIVINQLVLSKHPTADTVDGSILDYLYYLCTSVSPAIESQRINGWTWVNYQHLIAEMPLLKIKDPGAISKRLTKIQALGYILCKNDKHLNKKYVRLTPLFDELLTKIKTSEKGVDVDQDLHEGGVALKQRGVVLDQAISILYNNTIDKNTSSPEENPNTLVTESSKIEPSPHSKNISAKTYSNIDYLLHLTDEDVEWFLDRFPELDADEVRRQGERAYHNIHGRGAVKQYKNFQSVLRNWLDSPYNKKKPVGKGGIRVQD